MKKFQSEYIEELKGALASYCGCGLCPASHNFTVPPRCVILMHWFESWSLVWLVTEEERESICIIRTIFRRVLHIITSHKPTYY